MPGDLEGQSVECQDNDRPSFNMEESEDFYEDSQTDVVPETQFLPSSPKSLTSGRGKKPVVSEQEDKPPPIPPEKGEQDKQTDNTEVTRQT
ncbi:hypothetical protein ACOMHN_065123 [Nucella lapillus]